MATESRPADGMFGFPIIEKGNFMRSLEKNMWLWVLILVLAGTSQAFALEVNAVSPTDLAKQDGEKKDEERKDGWHFRLKPALNFSLADNRNVVGRPDGYTLILGVNIDTSVTLFRGKHEWRNTLMIAEAVSRTPLIDEFIISNDQFNFETLYMYYFRKWVGVYGRAAVQSPLFPGRDVQPETVMYAITRKDGRIDLFLDDKIRLHDAFAPLTLKQGLGPFFRPLEKEKVNLEFLLGLGAWETFADGNLTLADKAATKAIEVKFLEDTVQLGFESINRLWGDLWEKRIGYALAAELMAPFYIDPEPKNLDGAERLNVSLSARLDLRLVEWFFLSYQFKALREPQVLDEWQIQNNILLTLSYDLYKHVD